MSSSSRISQLTLAAVLIALCGSAIAQEVQPASAAAAESAAQPPLEAPRPEELEPAVDTSSTTPPAPSSAQPAPPQPASTAAPPASAAPAKTGRAMDRLELDTTQITGNRELPKVLYIVPWKRSDLGDLPGRPLNSLLDEVLAPVDRDVFRRENRYYRALQSESAPVGQPAPPE